MIDPAPAGTLTDKLVLVAAVTVAFTAPKYTTFNDGSAKNPVPLMVTEVPTGPEVGEIEVITCDRQTLPELMRMMAINTFLKLGIRFFINNKFSRLLEHRFKTVTIFWYAKYKKNVNSSGI